MRKLVIPQWLREVAPDSGVSAKDIRLMLGGISQAGFEKWRKTAGFPEQCFASRSVCDTRTWLVRDVIKFAKRQDAA